MSDLYSVSLASDQKENVIFSSYCLRWAPKNFGSKYRKNSYKKTHVFFIFANIIYRLIDRLSNSILSRCKKNL